MDGNATQPRSATARRVTFEFLIPFDGGPADICETMIRDRVKHSLLNSLSSIHPDIRVRTETTRLRDVSQR